MRDIMLDAKIVFEQESDCKGDVFYILRMEFGKNNILTLVRNDLDELLNEIPDFIRHTMKIQETS